MLSAPLWSRLRLHVIKANSGMDMMVIDSSLNPNMLHLPFFPQGSAEDEETSMPTVHNLVPIINDQSQYIHHLEAEVKFCKVSSSLKT